MAKKKYPDIQTKFDIKEFKKNLDECNFNLKVFTVKKVGHDFFMIVLDVDLEEGVGVVKRNKAFTKNKAVAYQTLEEISYRVNEGLPLTDKHKKLIGVSDDQ